MKRRWNYLNADKTTASSLKKLGLVHPVILQVLINRGLNTEDKIKEFLNPTLDNFSNPGDIPDIENAAKYLTGFIASGQKITVYGDYDVDGITSTVLMIEALKEMGAQNIDYYIPHRFSEGYGLNNEAIDRLNDAGTKLIITADCGISNYEEVRYAKNLGINVLITDHHLPPVVCPQAMHIVNPKLNNKNFAARDLAGVGVVFKLMEQMFQLKGHKPYSKSKKYLDLVALGTIADIVPLLKENRLLTILGLQQLNKYQRAGLKALARVSELPAETTTKDVSFGLAPRLNAAGRMEEASLSVDLLAATDFSSAMQMAKRLNQLNIRRQNVGSLIMDEVVALIEQLPNIEDKKVFVFSSTNWHPGIVGIVASQIVRKYNKPTVLIAVDGKFGRGSIRSLEGVDIFEPLSRCSYLLKDHGGHREAAGFEIEVAKIESFEKAYTEILNETISAQDLSPVLNIEMELSKKDISVELVNQIQKLAPFGQANRLPLFSTKDLSIIDFKQVGGGKHLKLTLTDGQELVDGIAFGQGDIYEQLLNGKRFEIAFSLEINEWNEQKKLQLNIKSIIEY